MAFFEKFTLVGYNITGDKPSQVKYVTDILSRVKILDSIKLNTLVYYFYDIQDGDTPEIIASKYYDNPNRHWIILMTNDIVDPIYDWPLSSSNFDSFIVSKYGSYANATTTIHHYEKIITKQDSVTNTVTTNRYVIDLDTYTNMSAMDVATYNLKDGNTVTVTTTKDIVYAYDFEYELNESKRRIKIIDKSYVQQIEKELEILLESNV